jgi:tRNA(Ile)-lysidine synthase
MPSAYAVAGVSNHPTLGEMPLQHAGAYTVTMRERLQFKIVPPGKWLLAVSGGQDSVALLHLALAVTNTTVANTSLVVGHIDHAMRSESAEDAAFVAQQATSLGLEVYTRRVDVPHIAAHRRGSTNLEALARQLRYQHLANIARGCGATAILTAHTATDQAETVLLQLLRGTAKAYGIQPQRNRVYRPLLWIERHELTEYLQNNNHSWRDDPSNLNIDLRRNWLRNTVFPLLITRFPQVVTQLGQYADIARLEDDYLSSQIDYLSARQKWDTYHPALQRRCIAHEIRQAGIAPDFAMVERLRLALQQGTRSRLALGESKTAVVHGHRVEVVAQSKPKPPKLPIDIDFTGFPGAIARFRQPGDRIQLPGGTRKLSDVLIDHNILREHRDAVPLVAQGQQVLWVGLNPPLLDRRLQAPPDPEMAAMQLALRLAAQSMQENEVPVGAVVLEHGVVIGQGRNRSRQLHDMTQHAELEALREAAHRRGNAYLNGCTLVVTLEPCLMCLGAALEARIGRIVFAADNPKNGALGGLGDALVWPWNHRPELRPGLLARPAAALLSEFFAQRRAGSVEHH